MSIRDLRRRICNWIFDQHGVRRLGREQREAEEQGVKDTKIGVDFGGDGSTHVAMFCGGKVVGSDQFLHQPHPFQEEVFNRYNRPPRFYVNQLVIVHSKHHGDWVACVDSRYRQGKDWRYEVSSPLYPVSKKRRMNVSEDILEPFSPSRVSPGWGLWAFSKPVSLRIQFFSPTANAAAAAEAFRRAQKEGRMFVHFDEVELTKDQEFGQDQLP